MKIIKVLGVFFGVIIAAFLTTFLFDVSWVMDHWLRISLVVGLVVMELVLGALWLRVLLSSLLK